MNDHIDNRFMHRPIPNGQLLACYQPIIALDTRRIVGYEVLGRLREPDGGGMRSLGPFFSDTRIPSDEHLRIDRLLREQAIAKLGTMPEPPALFINLKPSWIYRHYQQTGELHTLRLLERYGINPRNVCIEITEEEFVGSMSELNEVIDVYRAHGCQIAIDDFGAGFSNFDRIAQIRPNCLKVDIHLMKQSAKHNGYLGVLRSFSTLAEQIGASLLVEGVETSQDLQRAIQIGARYVQGYLFAPAEPEFLPQSIFSALIEDQLNAHRRQLQATERYWRELGSRLVASAASGGIRHRLEAVGTEESSAADFGRDCEQADQAIAEWLPHLDLPCLRVYLCRTNGIQLSSNHVRDAGEFWRREVEYRSADWSWRPYFIPHLSHDEHRVEAKISPKYADLDTHVWIRTLSIPVGQALVLFLDIADDQS